MLYLSSKTSFMQLQGNGFFRVSVYHLICVIAKHPYQNRQMLTAGRQLQ